MERLQLSDNPSPQELAARHHLETAQMMASEILATAAFYAHAILGSKMAVPRSWAHEVLAKAMDEAELAQMDCRGRA